MMISWKRTAPTGMRYRLVLEFIYETHKYIIPSAVPWETTLCISQPFKLYISISRKAQLSFQTEPLCEHDDILFVQKQSRSDIDFVDTCRPCVLFLCRSSESGKSAAQQSCFWEFNQGHFIWRSCLSGFDFDICRLGECDNSNEIVQ